MASTSGFFRDRQNESETENPFIDYDYQAKTLETVTNDLYLPQRITSSNCIAEQLAIFRLEYLMKALKEQHVHYKHRTDGPNKCCVLIMFDYEGQPYFEFHCKPNPTPIGWTSCDHSIDNRSMLFDYSLDIYMQVLEALEAEDSLSRNAHIDPSTHEQTQNNINNNDSSIKIEIIDLTNTEGEN